MVSVRLSEYNLKKLQVVCAIVWCLFSAGPIFGFAALKPVLVDQEVYRDVCLKDDETVPCIEQDMKLNMMFTVGAVVTNLIALPVGWVLDHYGPRICGFVGAFFISMGSMSFICSKFFESSIFDPYIVGYLMLAAGGPFVFISSFQLANTFPKYSGSILALITGAFDSSSALFLGYRLYYEKVDSGLNLTKFFKGYLVVPLFIVLCQLFIMPSESYKTLGAVQKLEIEGLDENGNIPDGLDESTIIRDDEERASLLSGHKSHMGPVLSNTSRRKSVLENYVEAKLETKTGGIFGVLHGFSATKQICSLWFLLMLSFTIVTMLRINYFVATVRAQEQYLLGDLDMALKVNAIFDVALPVGGLISIPFIGIILDNLPTFNILVIVCLTSIVIGIAGIIPLFLSNLIGILILVAFRPFYYTVVSDYCSKVFGFDTFGTVYGLMICMSGLFNLLQTYMDYLTHNKFNMNPTPVNLILLGTTACISIALLSFIKINSDRRSKMIKDAQSQNDVQYGTI